MPAAEYHGEDHGADAEDKRARMLTELLTCPPGLPW